MPSTMDKIRMLRDNAAHYIQSLLWIRDKRGQLVPFLFNDAQKRDVEAIKQMRSDRKPIRILKPKARQLGFSTLSEGLVFQDTATHKFVESLIIGYDDDNTQKLFEMSRLFYEKLPDPLKPMKRYSNRKELWFENPDERTRSDKPGLRSKITVETARNVKAGRGSTLQNLHGSEVAFWDNAKTLMSGLMQAVPREPNTMILLESTANGVGGYWYDMIMAAQRGENEWWLSFTPWFDGREYSMSTPHGFVKTEEERTLQKVYKVTDEQLAWRRWSIQNLCMGDIDIFMQEYPSNLEESFLVSGRPVFDTMRLHQMRRNCTPGDRYSIDDSYQIHPADRGELIIWELPQEGREYDIGADVSEGLPSGDYSAGVVIDHETGDMVAMLHGHFDENRYSWMLDSLGRFYNNALLGPEVNNMGHAVVNVLLNYSYYPALYFHDDYNAESGKNEQKPGWPTTPKTRPIMVAEGQSIIRDGSMRIPSVDLIGEMMTFVRNNKGKPEAQGKGQDGGCADDIVMAWLIAQQLRLRRPASIGHVMPPVIGSVAIRR